MVVEGVMIVWLAVPQQFQDVFSGIGKDRQLNRMKKNRS